MFKVGDIVRYKDITGKVIFTCEGSLSILIGDEFPTPTQTRVVVYNYDWGKVTLIQDDSAARSAHDSFEGVHYSPHRDENRVL